MQKYFNNSNFQKIYSIQNHLQNNQFTLIPPFPKTCRKKYLNMVSCCSFHLITIEAYSQQPNKKNSSPKFVLRMNQTAWLCQSYKIGYSKVGSANPCTGWGQVYLRGREICYYWKNTMLTGMNLFLNHQWKQK